MLARSTRPNPEDITQICFGIDTRTYTVVRILGKRNGSYTLGEGSYGNPHSIPLETEVILIHGYIDGLTCVPVHLLNTPITKDIEADLKAKAEKMKEEAAG
jgi:hypothetical protein